MVRTIVVVGLLLCAALSWAQVPSGSEPDGRFIVWVNEETLRLSLAVLLAAGLVPSLLALPRDDLSLAIEAYNETVPLTVVPEEGEEKQ